MLGLPEVASQHGPAIDNMIIAIHYFMFALFAVWGVFYIYCLVKFRAGNNPRADYAGVQSHGSTYLEIGVVAFEAFLLIFFAFPLWGSWVNNFPNKKDAVVARVVAEQFAWNIHYPGPDGEFGRTSIDLIDLETNPIGLDRKNDPKAKDDVVTLNQLHLPSQKPVLLHINSKDVIHSFKVPELRITQDAVPGLDIPITFTATKNGSYEIVCSQLCGIGHYRMKGFVNLKSPEEFDKWLAEQSAAQQGSGEGSDDVWG